MYGNPYIIPEGGTNNLALKGVAELIDEIDIGYDHICCAAGSGGTVAGLIAGHEGGKNITGFPVLKNADYLNGIIENLVLDYAGKQHGNWELNLNYHFGGFAKINAELIKFMDTFEAANRNKGIRLDPIYTGKLMYAINDMIDHGCFNGGETIIALHTGGLQGIAGMKEKMNRLRKENSVH